MCHQVSALESQPGQERSVLLMACATASDFYARELQEKSSARMHPADDPCQTHLGTRLDLQRWPAFFLALSPGKHCLSAQRLDLCLLLPLGLGLQVAD